MRNFLYVLLILPTSVSGQYNYSIDDIPIELQQDANLVVRNQAIKIDIKSQSSYTYTVAETVSILNINGEQPLYISYSKSHKIKSLTATVYDDRGAVIKQLKKKHFQDYSATGTNFHGDNRVLMYEHPTNDYPYTMSVTYSIETPNTVFIPRWQPISGYYKSVQKSSYTISCPEQLGMRVSELNFKDYDISKSEITGGFTVQLENIPARKHETLSPPLQELTPFLSVALDHFHLEGVDGSAANWAEFGKWYYDNLLRAQKILPSNIVAEIKLLTKDITDPLEKAKKVYEFVQQRSRYISIQLGIGGWKPTSASEVHELGYGDCKGLTNYTHALLSVLDIESFYCPIYAGNQIENIKHDFHGMQGNHVILCVPDPNGADSIWVECTSQDAPFGYIGDFTDDRDLLVISPSGGKIQHTTTYDEANSIRKQEGEININEEGNISIVLKKSHSGIFYKRQYMQSQNEKDIKQEFISEYNHLGSTTINGYEFEDQKKESKFVEKLTLSCDGFAQAIGKDIIFTPNLFPNRISAPDRVRNRKSPFVISRSASYQDSMVFNVPKDMIFQHIPEDVMIESEFGNYEVTLEQKGDHSIYYNRKYISRKGNYGKEKYKEYREFLKTILKLDNRKIVLNKIK